MPRLSYESLDLPKSVVGWVYRHASRNYWRVSDWYELDDLIQDGLMVAYKCRERYGTPGTDIDPPHFMALVKTAFYRHITEVLRHSRAEQANVSRAADLVAGYESESDAIDRRAVPIEPEGDLASLIAGMPDALRRAVRTYLERPEAFRRHRVLLSGDESESRLMHRLTGFPLRCDFETELRAYLWEATHVAC